MKTNHLSVALAMCAHELNRAYCSAMGDLTQLPWAEAPKWQQDSALAGVAMHLANPDATPEQSHESWLAQKTAEGWVYGEVKDAAKKEHPCFLPYAELPDSQKAKDYIFRAAVHNVSAAIALLQAKSEPQPAALQLTDAVLVGVTYIHRRGEWVDKNYGTGLTFSKGQTRFLPLDVAMKLLRHQDLFAKHEGEAAIATVESASDDGTAASLAQAGKEKAKLQSEQHDLMDLHDSVNQMGKDELAQYAMTNFKQTIDKRQKVDVMRAQVNQFLDQFGV